MTNSPLKDKKAGGMPPRIFKNSMIFCYVDGDAIDLLVTSIKDYLDWKLIDSDIRFRESLTGHDLRIIETRLKQLNDIIALKLSSTFKWAIVPTQPDPANSKIEWETLKPQADKTIALSVSKKLLSDELLSDIYSGARLKMVLDRYVWKNSEIKHISIKKLWGMFLTYLYFDRLKNDQVLKQAIETAVSGPAPKIAPKKFDTIIHSKGVNLWDKYVTEKNRLSPN